MSLYSNDAALWGEGLLNYWLLSGGALTPVREVFGAVGTVFDAESEFIVAKLLCNSVTRTPLFMAFSPLSVVLAVFLPKPVR